jgi:hypothetical protein
MAIPTHTPTSARLQAFQRILDYHKRGRNADASHDSFARMLEVILGMSDGSISGQVYDKSSVEWAVKTWYEIAFDEDFPSNGE